MVAPNERMKPLARYLNPTLDSSLTVDNEMPTEKVKPVDLAEMETQKEYPRAGSVSAEMGTERMDSQPGEAVLADEEMTTAVEVARIQIPPMGVPEPAQRMPIKPEATAVTVVETAPVTADKPAPAAVPDAQRIAQVRSNITQLDSRRPMPTAAEVRTQEDRRRFEVLTRDVANTKAQVAELSKGNFIVRAWNAAARREHEKHLASYEKQLAEVTGRHPEWARKNIAIVQDAADTTQTAYDRAYPRTRKEPWSTTERTKAFYTVEQKLVKTRFENLQRTIRAKQELVTRLEETEPRSASTRYEQNALIQLSQELDRVYSANKTFIDSLPNESPEQKQKRA